MIENIDKTIEFLQELRKEEQKKQLTRLNDTLKNEIETTIKNALISFESDNFVEFQEKNGINVCYDFNFVEIMENVEKIIKVNVWEID